MCLIANDALVEILRQRIGRSGGPSLYAKGLGVSCAFISAVINGNKYVSGKILEDLGYERVIGFRKVTLPEASPDASASTDQDLSPIVPRREAGPR